MLTAKPYFSTTTSISSADVKTAQIKPSVVIVGGGFCGTTLAINLLRLAQRPLQVVLLEPRPVLGQGVAYSTKDPQHLLNVPANNMSALVGEPGHFLEWLVQHAGVLAPFVAAERGGYVPRYVYGRYLQDTLEASVRRACSGVTFASVQAEAVALEPAAHGMSIHLANGQSLNASAAVLALGNLPPRRLPNIPAELVEREHYKADPWKEGALENLQADDELLIVGTGLTMVDLVVSLRSRGHRGRICALSRRGLLPQAHLSRCIHSSPNLYALVEQLEQSPPKTAAKLLKQVRAEVKAHSRRGGAWQEVVDSLRPITPALWRSLTEAERMRYLKRVRPYWEAHRHRIAPQIADTLKVCRDAGQLKVLAGRLRELRPTETGIEVKISERDGSCVTLHVSHVINATGPETDLRYTSHPLLRSLLETDDIRPDATGLGFEVDLSGRVRGRANLQLYALGALRRNESYEGTAVPELRHQAYDLAQTLVEKLIFRDESRVMPRLTSV